MRVGTSIVATIVSACLIGTAAVLFMMVKKSPHTNYEEAMEIVRKTQDISANWSIEMARVFSDPLADFDKLTAFAPKIEQLQRALRDTTRKIETLPDRLGNDIQVFLSAIDSKKERIEGFKTTYAVVRNSTGYLPLAAGNAMRQANRVGAKKLENEIAVLAQDVTTFLASPSGNTREHLVKRVDQLRETSVSQEPSLTNAIANLLAHTEVLLSRQEPMNALFQNATSNEISDLAQRLETDLGNRAQKHAEHASNLEIAVYGTTGLTVVLWILLGIYRRSRSEEYREPRTESTGEMETMFADPEEIVDEEDTQRFERRETEQGGESRLGKEDGSDGAMAAVMGVRYRFITEHIASISGRIATQILKRISFMEQTHARARTSVMGQQHGLVEENEVNLAEELETARAITAQVQREVATIKNLAQRLASGGEISGAAEQRQMVNMNECVDNMAHWFEERDGFKISRQLGHMPELFVARTELCMVLKEIFENAVQATAATGRNPRISVQTRAQDGKAQVTLTDNGEGIAPENRKRIFRAFMSTREKNAGLGLTLVSMLVRKHEGGIRVSSIESEGTIIRISLPITMGRQG